MAATGRQLKQSVNVFHNLMLYLLLPVAIRRTKTLDERGIRACHMIGRRVLTLVIEAINTIDGSAFVIASQEEKVLRVLNFIREQQTDCFQRLFSPIHVVAQEQIVTFRRKAAVLEQAQQVVVLAMDVTCSRQSRGFVTRCSSLVTSGACDRHPDDRWLLLTETVTARVREKSSETTAGTSAPS